jgi:hypothetical protein
LESQRSGTLLTQKVTSDFNRRKPFAQFLASQNSKGKYENRKILDFVREMRKIDSSPQR